MVQNNGFLVDDAAFRPNVCGIIELILNIANVIFVGLHRNYYKINMPGHITPRLYLANSQDMCKQFNRINVKDSSNRLL